MKFVCLCTIAFAFFYSFFSSSASYTEQDNLEKYPVIFEQSSIYAVKRMVYWHWNIRMKNIVEQKCISLKQDDLLKNRISLFINIKWVRK